MANLVALSETDVIALATGRLILQAAMYASKCDQLTNELAQISKELEDLKPKTKPKSK